MKERKVKDKSTGARTLIVRGTRGEQLDYGRAEWLAVRPSPLLLPFKYEIGKRRFLFYYDVTGLPTLREYLAMGISGSQYVSLLTSLGELGDLCSSADLPMEMVRFEPENIYVSGGRMLFCCLPLKPAVQQVSVLDLLKVLADPAKVKFVLPDDRRLAELTMDFVRRSRVFSAFDFDEFLARRFNAGEVSSVYRDSVSGNLSVRQGPSDVVFDPFAGSEVDERASVAQSLPWESPADAVAPLVDAVVEGGSSRLVQPSVMSSTDDVCADGVHGSEQRGGSAFDSGTRALSGVLKETSDTLADTAGNASLPLRDAGGGNSGPLGDSSCPASLVSYRHASFVPFCGGA